MEPDVESMARQVVCRALAGALADPRSKAACAAGVNAEILRAAWDVLREEAGADPALAPGEVDPWQAGAEPLADWLGRPLGEREAVHQRVFGLLISRACPPYETEYLPSKDPTHRAQHLADAAGFYHAFGLTPDRAHPERPDHAAVELEFVAFLAEKIARCGPGASEPRAVCEHALHSFLRDHVVWWLPALGALLERRVREVSADDPGSRCGFDALAGVARLVSAWAGLERRGLGLPFSPARPEPALAPAADAACGSCALGV